MRLQAKDDKDDKRYTTLLAPKSCCNPFLEHDANRRGTSAITTALTDLHPRLRLIPGHPRVCHEYNRRCYKTLKTQASGSLARETGASKSDTEAASQDVEEGRVATGESSMTRSRRQTDRSSCAKRRLRYIHEGVGLAQPSSSSAQINTEFYVVGNVTLMQDLKETYNCEHERGKKNRNSDTVTKVAVRSKNYGFFRCT